MQVTAQPFTPEEGQPGKDVVWVPTPPELVERMLDLVKVTPQDFVMDLGSGDGRNLIAAARRGARARGVEFNPDMVALSRRAAAEAGVGARVEIVQGDMYAADISQATVLALFLLPSNLLEFRIKFFNLAPGTRIVSNTFGIEGWEPDVKDTPPGCRTWCTALLWIVPAKIEGTWRMPEGDLSLSQTFQKVSGVLDGRPITGGRLRGEEITFNCGARLSGVSGNPVGSKGFGSPAFGWQLT